MKKFIVLMVTFVVFSAGCSPIGTLADKELVEAEAERTEAETELTEAETDQAGMEIVQEGQRKLGDVIDALIVELRDERRVSREIMKELIGIIAEREKGVSPWLTAFIGALIGVIIVLVMRGQKKEVVIITRPDVGQFGLPLQGGLLDQPIHYLDMTANERHGVSDDYQAITQAERRA